MELSSARSEMFCSAEQEPQLQRSFNDIYCTVCYSAKESDNILVVFLQDPCATLKQAKQSAYPDLTSHRFTHRLISFKSAVMNVSNNRQIWGFLLIQKVFFLLIKIQKKSIVKSQI